MPRLNHAPQGGLLPDPAPYLKSPYPPPPSSPHPPPYLNHASLRRNPRGARGRSGRGLRLPLHEPHADASVSSSSSVPPSRLPLHSPVRTIGKKRPRHDTSTALPRLSLSSPITSSPAPAPSPHGPHRRHSFPTSPPFQTHHRQFHASAPPPSHPTSVPRQRQAKPPSRGPPQAGKPTGPPPLNVYLSPQEGTEGAGEGGVEGVELGFNYWVHERTKVLGEDVARTILYVLPPRLRHPTDTAAPALPPSLPPSLPPFLRPGTLADARRVIVVNVTGLSPSDAVRDLHPSLAPILTSLSSVPIRYTATHDANPRPDHLLSAAASLLWLPPSLPPSLLPSLPPAFPRGRGLGAVLQEHEVVLEGGKEGGREEEGREGGRWVLRPRASEEMEAVSASEESEVEEGEEVEEGGRQGVEEGRGCLLWEVAGEGGGEGGSRVLGGSWSLRWKGKGGGGREKEGKQELRLRWGGGGGATEEGGRILAGTYVIDEQGGGGGKGGGGRAAWRLTRTSTSTRTGDELGGPRVLLPSFPPFLTVTGLHPLAAPPPSSPSTLPPALLPALHPALTLQWLMQEVKRVMDPEEVASFALTEEEQLRQRFPLPAGEGGKEVEEEEGGEGGWVQSKRWAAGEWTGGKGGREGEGEEGREEEEWKGSSRGWEALGFHGGDWAEEEEKAGVEVEEEGGREEGAEVEEGEVEEGHDETEEAASPPPPSRQSPPPSPPSSPPSLALLAEAPTYLVGHGLEGDLRALRIHHPYLIDTAVLYPHPKGAPYKRSLKDLAKDLLDGREVQAGHGSSGHDSYQDAVTALELALLKMTQAPGFAIPEAWAEGGREGGQEPLFGGYRREGDAVWVAQEVKKGLVEGGREDGKEGGGEGSVEILHSRTFSGWISPLRERPFPSLPAPPPALPPPFPRLTEVDAFLAHLVDGMAPGTLVLVAVQGPLAPVYELLEAKQRCRWDVPPSSSSSSGGARTVAGTVRVPWGEEEERALLAYAADALNGVVFMGVKRA
ncbi:hypothetical protein NSK_006455 [Nannochloropsis salina CCMP1776]|uniref:Exonuclease domain-containing protein n=1 Tax=Nannochloropsis salina CCMP1776 TaxID=1027361 RepID=A0A4D9CTF1_9STRA|nr:hypothetical protein NSK_006455 [Nannochloropsis salina CCMP1776]|eukprot:TFJ82126.1 hypothetical protein NSK_006455 [Nannochloropsis salina CCMP1776]